MTRSLTKINLPAAWWQAFASRIWPPWRLDLWFIAALIAGSTNGALINCTCRGNTIATEIDMVAEHSDTLLVTQIRNGDQRAWSDLIASYEGRLLAFAESRIGNRAASEDIVQEAFVGFLTSLPNYDGTRPLESYLFSICAYKITDHLRREGRRPAITFSSVSHSETPWELSAHQRPVSSIVRSTERRDLEEQAVGEAIAQQIERWKSGNQWNKLRCMELAFVRGMDNKPIAEELNLTQQQVANFKSDFLKRIAAIVARMNLNAEIFPELVSDVDHS